MAEWLKAAVCQSATSANQINKNFENGRMSPSNSINGLEGDFETESGGAPRAPIRKQSFW
jgi:hypothetical protein